MKNADKPAMPQAATSNGYGCNYTENYNGEVPTGMTKREMIAMHSMQAILNDSDYCSNRSPTDIAELAVIHADALLEALEA